MTKLNTIILLAFTLSFHAMVSAICTISKEPEIHEETYWDCGRYYSGNCERIRMVEKGPIIYICLHTDIEEINANMHKAIENIIFIQQSNITSLNLNTRSWRNITEFYLDSTNTSKIEPGFFKDFDELQVLEISNNQLEVIIDGIFSSLSLLTKLNLSSNSIKTITDYSLSGLLNLKVLDLSNNKISFISPNTFDSKPFLEYIDMSKNFLVDINYAFASLIVKTVNLSKNKLTSFNFIQFADSGVLNIKVIDLSQNDIQTISNLNYTCVETLSLAFNRIGELKGAQCITNLNMSNNKLESLHDSNFTSQLKWLDISHNQIAELNGSYLQNSSNLEYLDLSYNVLQTIPRDTFMNQSILRSLNLAHNNFKQIPFGLFNNLNSLTLLDVSDNNMVLDFDTLTTLIHLQELHFKNNQVKNFNPQILLNRFKDLNYITLSDNLWNCSELANTIHLLQLKSIKISNGNNINSNNIFGISCKDDKELREEIIQLKTSKPTENAKPASRNSNETYDKSIEINNNYYNETLNSLNKTLSQLSDTLDTILRTQNAYLNTSVANLSESTKTDLKGQNENLKAFLIDLKSLLSSRDLSHENMSEPTPSIIEDKTYKTLSEGIFICNFLLMLILGCILYLLLYYLKCQKHVRPNFQDQIHLI